ncbi:MAG: hypothetical protein II937_09875 [Bacteroidales bacterium]|nr:hypothetical protein [Bacteroidales bacterium]
MTDTERRKKLVKWLDAMLKKLRTLTVSTFVQAIEELRNYIEAGGDFKWNAHGIHERKVMNLLRILEGKINLLIGSGVSRWYQEGLNNATEQAEQAIAKLTKSNRQPYGLRKLKQQATEARRMEAVAGHAQTVSYRGGAMNNLSNRVWDFKGDSKKIIEQIVHDAIKGGKGVNETKNSVKEFLNTDGNGKMKHGGKPGVYKNPEKNCERLMRTEVNAAYRSAEIDSYNAMDVVLGYEIHLSGNHTTTRRNSKGEEKIIELNDICDQCAGKYPKNFVWFGWHPNCRCYITPITMTPAQFAKYWDAQDEGKGKEYLDSIMIKDFPDGFKQYFAAHFMQFKAIAANPQKALPQWIKSNPLILTRLTDTTMKERQNEYLKLNSDPDYTDVKFDPTTGGLMARHKGHNSQGTGSFFANLTPDGKPLTGLDLENKCIEELFTMGNSVIVQPEGIDNANGTQNKALDIILNGVRMDIKSVTEDRAFYRNQLKEKNGQLVGWNAQNPNDLSNSVMLFFYDPSMYSDKKIIDGIYHYLNDRLKNGQHYYGQQNQLKKVYCVVRGISKIFDFDVI